mmetsp:Transcript_71848/g.99528  ORF Transcript_71848/g.99528 Transcript_71848/m.99528 type:complete len:144 (+) Transcript_71848:207-638(+)|eukprot:CAMPEP_0176382966 /NCGR_PEP_ID=MMETSP0126-20121128/33108_1 /TAXON_ID=141414 ORGANISM="Strombidinopsis acuminatum, Strain SPMC142" /NCGR_SAMPLE_ID=MMETSP0126 /ASSEMBLY_ACC=CAM_ASM_000229 /LENGTH=143 /DNA_ID=CAMNT_0017747715 /DNA_START=194 /DNA_END=625 /DNA_ORIENTATION=+
MDDADDIISKMCDDEETDYSDFVEEVIAFARTLKWESYDSDDEDLCDNVTKFRQDLLSSFKVIILKEGYGGTPVTPESIVALHYTALINNRVVDTSRDWENDKFCIVVLGQNQVIKGWEKGFLQLRSGTRAIIRCPPEYAYGN